jgi:hypothetical protein
VNDLGVKDGNLSQAEALKVIDSMISKLNLLKKKLDESKKAEDVQLRKCKARLDHLSICVPGMSMNMKVISAQTPLLRLLCFAHSLLVFCSFPSLFFSSLRFTFYCLLLFCSLSSLSIICCCYFFVASILPTLLVTDVLFALSGASASLSSSRGVPLEAAATELFQTIRVDRLLVDCKTETFYFSHIFSLSFLLTDMLREGLYDVAAQ